MGVGGGDGVGDGVETEVSKNSKHTINEKVRAATRRFTPAGFKSLLQKIIRFRTRKVDLGGGNMVDSLVAAKSTFLLLMNNSGSFVPDIQRFVTGTESALKRLVVILLEDSFVFDTNKAVSIMLGAFLAQRLPSWKPPSYLTSYALGLIEEALRSPKAYNFNIPRGLKLEPFVINPSSKPLELVSSLLEEIRSFGSDLGMVRDIVTNFYSGALVYTELKSRPEMMPLLHCIDQHWAPEIAYFYPKDFVRTLKVEGSRPFSKLFIKLFSEVTGVNPRRPLRKGRTMTPIGYTEGFESKEFVKMTRLAQRLVLLAKSKPDKKYCDLGGDLVDDLGGDSKDSDYNFEYDLDDGWIAGMVGAIEIKGRPTSLVSLNPRNPYDLVAVRKPSRNMKTALLNEKQKTRAIALAKEKLRQGVAMNKTLPPVPKLKSSRLVFDKGMYWIIKKNKRVMWENMKKGVEKVDYVVDVEFSLENALRFEGLGAVKDFEKKIKESMAKYKISEINRALTYISDRSGYFEIARVNKTGGSTDKVVTIDDCGAYQFILHLSTLCPSAFKRVTSLKFKVLFGPLMWRIKDIVQTEIRRGKTSKTSTSGWPEFGERTNRKLHPHQTEALDELKDSHARGRSGNFVYMTVGLGKTLLVFSYLQYLREMNQLPDYVLYTLPSSAIKSIIKEIEAFGLDFTLILPLKAIKPFYRGKDYVIHSLKPTLKKNAINLIEHDHLRRCEESLYKFMPESIFIMDEVHKAFNNTKRTQVSLQLSVLSKEFVAMTGTPIIDTNTYKLIWWLSKIVSFEVNESNFWVAANAMISKRLKTKVKVVASEILVDMNEDELKVYRQSVSPKLGGNNTQPKPEDTLKALRECYQATTRGIVEQTLKNLKKGVFIVAKDIKHQNIIKNKLSLVGVDSVFLIEKYSSILLTDDEVENGNQKDYKVVITTKNKVEGYSLTRLKVMITGVYPSNNAVREQLEGRINRIGQNSDKVWNITVHTGILTYILKKHTDAKNISAVLNSISKEFKF